MRVDNQTLIKLGCLDAGKKSWLRSQVALNGFVIGDRVVDVITIGSQLRTGNPCAEFVSPNADLHCPLPRKF